jgi:hypothetical protein
MPTGRHNLIQLGSSYLTTTGLVGGIPCKTDVSGLNVLKFGRVGQTIIALDGTSWTQSYSVKGVPISFSVFRMTSTLLTTVSDAMRSAVTTGTAMTLNITGGAFGDHYLTVMPLFPTPIEASGEFYLTTAYDVKFNFVVQSQTFTLTPTAGTLTLTGQSVTLTKTP